MQVAYKLVRKLRDGSLAPLFIDRKSRFEKGVWLEAKAIPTPGFAFRPGFHAAEKPVAPHLSEKGRVWVKVLIDGERRYIRPQHQGGVWYTADKMMILEELNGKPSSPTEG